MLRGVRRVVLHGSEGHDPCQEEHREGGEQPLPLEAAVAVRHLVGLNESRVVAIRCACYETEAPVDKKEEEKKKEERQEIRNKSQ